MKSVPTLHVACSEKVQKISRNLFKTVRSVIIDIFKEWGQFFTLQRVEEWGQLFTLHKLKEWG